MKRTDIKQMAFVAITTLLVASCASEDMTEGNQLPEGKYPVVIDAVNVSGNAQTRVSENADGSSSVFDWKGTEQIGVSINGKSATYTLNTDKSISSEAPLYWSNTDVATVSAQYPATDGTVDLSNQASGLAYVMTGTGTGNYAKGVTLSFTHQLAKVRVKLTGDKAADMTSVQIYSYTSCTHTQGASVTGSVEGWITMYPATYNNEKCWEANVVPGYAITKAKVNETECTLTASVTPVAQKWHEVTIDVEKTPVEIQPGQDGNYTVNKGDKVIIKGNGSQTTGQIIINGTATVIIQDINIQPSVPASLPEVAMNRVLSPIVIADGTATIKLKGENTLASAVFLNETSFEKFSGAGIQLVNNNSHVVIEGEANASLTVSSQWGCAAIGGNLWGEVGNITIKNAKINASTTENYENGAGAAIGSGSTYYSWTKKASCGVITIINSDITASVSGSGNELSAVIGSGEASRNGETSKDDETNRCEGINIHLQEGQTKDAFLGNLTGGTTSKVGAGGGRGTNSCGFINWYNSDGSLITE